MRLLSGVALVLAATVTVVSAQEGGERGRLAQDIHALHDMATGRMAYDRQRALQFSESLRRLASRPDGWRFHKLPDLERSEVAAWRSEIARFVAAATEGQDALQQVARSGGDGCRSCHVTEKTASPQDFGVGDTITYTYIIRNEGTQPIDGPVIGIVNGQEVYGPIGVDVQDDKIPSTSIQCQPDPAPSVLPPGGEFICTAQYTATQADVNAGSITNIANGRINDGDSTEEGTATVTARPGGRKTVSIVKNADRSSFGAGDVVTYTFTVTNTGDLPLQAPLTIDDDRIGPVACAVPGGVLAVGASVTCTAQYAVSPDNLLYPALVNRATAQIEDAGSNLAAVQIDNESDIALRKFAQPATFSAGDTITYVYQVWNTSGATMPTPFTLTVDDDRIATVNCPPNPTPWYSPGVRMCFASHVATAADVAAGQITNTATATVSTGGITMTSPPATATVTAERLELVKQPDQPWFQDGEAISWTFTVTNATGQTVPGPITISDTLLGPVSCGPGPLAPGASTTCTASYQTTAADAANGEVVNTASVAAGALSSLPVSAVTPHAGLSLEKTGSPQEFWQGDVITYTYTVTNTGSAALPGLVTVSDNRLGAVACPPVASLAPGASVDCTATYTAKGADAEIGRIDNTATASAGGGAVVSDPATETVYARRLVLEKVADRDVYMPGETITYTYRIRNAGTSPILWNAAQVSDDRIPTVLCPSLAGGGQAVLQPGQSVTCSGLYQTTIADLRRGCIVNRATALLGGQATNVATAEVCPRVDRLPPDVIGSPTVSDIRPVGRPAPPVIDSGAAQPLPNSGLRDAAIPALLGLGTGAMLLFLDNDGDAAASTTGTR